MMQEKRNSAISCCRVVSMLMIVLCHVIAKYTFIPGHTFLGQVLNVGVYTFLSISGFLYGSRTIPNVFTWLGKRFIAVVFPSWIMAVCVILWEFLVGNHISPFTIAVYLLGAQGLGFVFPGFYRYFAEIKVLGPLWFITVIMLCYCILPLLQRYRDRLSGSKQFLTFALLTSTLSFILALKCGVILFYFLTFAIGYFLAASNHRHALRKRPFIGATVLMAVSQTVRIVLMLLFDGTPFYQTYTYFSHMILGIWIMCFFLALQQIIPVLIDRLAGSPVMAVADNMSMYIYLTHYCFCRGTLDMYQIFDNLLLATLTFTAAVLLSALILKKLVETLMLCLKLKK